MPNLFVYGCSNSESFNTKAHWAINYVKWKGYIPKTYGELISDKLNLNLINYSKSGTNNQFIFQKICETFKKIKEDDVVIVQWTNVIRFRLVNDKNEWVEFYYGNDDYLKKLNQFENISKQTITEIFVNRMNPKYLEEIKTWELIIKQVLNKNKLLFWSPFEEFNSYHLLERIETETNGEIHDIHISENGHKDLSELLLKDLNTNKINFI